VDTILNELRNDITQLTCLTELDLGYTGNIVNDVFVQGIILHLRKLKNLRLCKSLVTDVGLTGCIPEVGLLSRLPGASLTRLEGKNLI